MRPIFGIFNMNLVYFIYGLAFFLLGFAVLIKNRRSSEFRLANSLIYLSFFGLLHGFYEWGYIFIPMQKELFSSVIINELYFLRIIIEALSYAFLFYFGIHLLVNTKQKYRWLLVLPYFMFIIWITLAIYFRFKVDISHFEIWLNSGDVWARYLLALPGVVAVCYALFLQGSELKMLQNKKIINNLYAFITFVLLYGIVGGIIVPENTYFLAKYINANVFLKIFKLPIQLFRGIAGIGMTYCLIGILEMYEIEYHQKLEKVKKERAVLNERQRICRNLHDGIIQSIYGMGLKLENVSYLIEEEPVRAKEELRDSLDKLNGVIGDIRNYIMDLKPEIAEIETLDQLLKKVLNDFDASGIAVNYDYEITETLKFFPEHLDNLYHVLQEGLNNIRQHARADIISLTVRNEGEEIEIGLKDNGIGFDDGLVDSRQRSKQGLKNMQERIKLLNGKFDINSIKRQGTEIIIKIPYEVIKGVCNKNNDS